MRTFFITGTDTGVGKTYAMLVLGSLLQEAGYNPGIFKPVQSGVGDAEFLKAKLGIADGVRAINPYFSREPLSPHLALKRAGVVVTPESIMQSFSRVACGRDIMLVEGAGGFLVPIAGSYLMADLAFDLRAEIVIVARLGLGTINHTLLTVREAQRRGFRVAGIIFADAANTGRRLVEQTNPQAVRELTGVDVLGTIPFLRKTDLACVRRRCRARIDLDALLALPPDESGRLMALDKKYVWHPFTQMQDWVCDVPGAPLVIDKADGNYLVDAAGRRYLDGVSSLWVTVHGHRKRELDAALKAQADKLAHSTMLGLANTPAIELAEKLVGIAPRGLAKVFYSDNGSTSVEVALKMAYQYWQNVGRKKKTALVHLANSYHGDTLGSVSVGGIRLFHEVYRELVLDTIQLPMPDCYRAPAGKKYPAYAFEVLERFEALLEKKHDTIAALVLEPLVQGAAGMIMWPAGVLKGFSRLCRKYDVFLIADEVATGFGRTGKMFACAHENVAPDFLCVAKGITGGYLPLAATLTTQRVYDGFLFPYQDMKAFFHGHTYTGNPLACAVAIANIEIFRTERVLEKMKPKVRFLHERLQPLLGHPSVGDIRQRGFMVGIELVRDKAGKEPFAWQERVGAQVCERARVYGVILRPLGNVIVLMPPLSVSVQELDMLVTSVERAVADVLGHADLIKGGGL